MMLAWQSVNQPAPAEAATITVTTTTDELNTDGDCSLREAIQAANTDTGVDACLAGSGLDTIFVPSGVYTITRAGADEDSNATGDFDIGSEVIIQGATTNRPEISGNHLDRVFDVVYSFLTSPDLRLENLKITNGRADYGGGIRDTSYDGTLTLSNVLLDSNSASFDGGAIYNENEWGMGVRSSVISNNTAGNKGGGIYYSEWAGVGVIDTQFTNNHANIAGGALYLRGESDVTGSIIRDASFNDNSAGIGGAVYADYMLLNVYDSRFIANSANDGGAIYEIGDEYLIANGSCFVNNSHTSVYYTTTTNFVSDADATGNWWGAVNGPSGEGSGDGDSVGADINYSDFLANDNLNCGFTGATPPPTPDPDSAPSLNTPNLGLVIVHTTEAQPVYDSAGGGLVHIAGEELWIPNDADGSGYDTYMVTGYTIIGDEIWISIFLGNAQYGWIPLRLATPITALDVN
jgi:CSLREA domain-containing protein